LCAASGLSIPHHHELEKLVQAHRLELVLPGVRDGRVARVGQHDRRAVGAEQGEEFQAGLDRPGLGKESLRIFGSDRLNVSERGAAEMREFLRRQSQACFVVASHCSYSSFSRLLRDLLRANLSLALGY